MIENYYSPNIQTAPKVTEEVESSHPDFKARLCFQREQYTDCLQGTNLTTCEKDISYIDAHTNNIKSLSITESSIYNHFQPNNLSLFESYIWAHYISSGNFQPYIIGSGKNDQWFADDTHHHKRN